ncbi:DNA ligase [Paenibacillus sp. 7124]|uniref:DNA ligase n=1 Tax=Paenibacillus apii TaxID=1850370 RepID=A0A6M1PF13_9BACL|nr:DNA ligase [Paenibacillus apii]NGM81174.1 DNA ligase [Paenibacillus apii]
MNIGSLIRGLLGDSKPGEAKTLELKEGQVVRGVVLSVSESGKEAVVQIQGTPVRAELETPLQQGQTLNLQVGPSGDQGLPVLKPAPTGTAVSPQTMGEALEALGLSDAKTGREIIQAMQSGGLPLNKETAAKLNAVMEAKPANVPVMEWLEAAVISEKRGLPITPESIRGIRQAVFGPQLHQLLSALEEQLSLWIGQLEAASGEPAQQSGSNNGATPLDNRSYQGQAGNQAGTVLSAGDAAEGSTGGAQAGKAAGAKGETAAAGYGAASPQPEGEGASGSSSRQGNGGVTSIVSEGGGTGSGAGKPDADAGGRSGVQSAGGGAQATTADGVDQAGPGRAGASMSGAQAAGNGSSAGAEAARAGETEPGGAAQRGGLAAGEVRAGGAQAGVTEAGGAAQAKGLDIGKVQAGGAQAIGQATGEMQAGGAPQAGGPAAGVAQAGGAVQAEGLDADKVQAGGMQADVLAAGERAQAGGAAAGAQPQAGALLAKLQGVLGELRDALPQLAALPPSDPAGEPARADTSRGNPAAAAPPQPEATQGGAWVARVLKLLGAEHEQLALRGGAAQAAAEQGAVAGGHAGDTVKGVLLQAMASSDVPAAVKEAAGQLVQHLTGQQLLLNTDRTAPFAQVTLFLPLKGPDGTETASVHIQSRRGHKGELDASNCRLWFDLDMKSLGQTLVDVQVVDRIVSLKLHNNEAWVHELLESSKDDIKSAMETIGYQLSSFKAEVFPAQSQEKAGKGPVSPADYFPDAYRGVDYRI